MRKLRALALLALLLPTAALGQAGVQIGSGQVFGNSTAARAPGKTETVTAIFDRAMGSTRGSILRRGASGWAAVVPSATVGLPWVGNGTGADPAYQLLGVAGGGTGLNTLAIGDLLYASSTSALARLADVATGNVLLSGGVGVAPSYGKVTSSHLNITPTTCTNQFVTAISATGTATCTTDTLASAQHANQGTTTTVLHGNAAGNPSFGAVALGTDVSGTLPNANIASGAANTMKGSTSGAATSDIALVSCSVAYRFTQWVTGTGWQCGISPILPSRAIAATLNLSAFQAVTTQGYNTPGDGGGTTYFNANSAVNTYTITTAGSCANGTWTGVKFNGGTGKGFQGTVVCAGGVATVVTPIGAGSRGNFYTANDVLTASCNNIGSCVTPPQITVNTIGNRPITDAFTATFTTPTPGTTCTNGTYYGVQPINGDGSRLTGVAVISGNALASFTQSTPGGAYKVGNQLTLTGIAGCGTNPVIQVATLSTPLASFTDSAGNAWQYAPEGNINIRHFGAISDAVSGQTDADWTDNGAAVRAAFQYASIGNGPSDTAAGINGQTVYVPQGAFKVCGGFTIYEYTTLAGSAWGGSQLKQCNSDSAGTNFATLGDSNAHFGNFQNKIRDITLFGGFGSGSAYMIYSNNSQSGDSVSNVAIYGLSRGCVKYDTGYGGQSMFGIHSVLCVTNSTYFTSGGPALDLSGNFGFVIDGQTHIAGASAGGAGVRLGDGGTNFVNGLHCEGGVTNCISINGSGSSPPQTTIIGPLGPATNLVYIETGTPANYTTVINARGNGSTCTVYKQATATCAITGNQTGLTTY